jgi:hypothetical protein
MNKDIKYIYFELYSLNGSKPIIQNENILLIKPTTNSNGVYEYRNVNERKKMNSVNDTIIIDQCWIDLTKYVFGNRRPFTFNSREYWINECSTRLNLKLREEKLKEILEESGI